MKDQLLQIAERAPAGQRQNVAREYVQLLLLRLLHERGAQRHLAFCGGTALRLLHGLSRFSEDLDFCLSPDAEPFDARTLLTRLKTGCERSGYGMGLKAKVDRTVAMGLFRFEGLPAELGLVPDPRLALTVKVEIDTRPPAGARVETTLIQRFFPIALRHHDLASLMAGKLHALLARPWPKGRDWYDLVWYLTEQSQVSPNLTLLENALSQTGHDPGWAAHWPAQLQKRLKEHDWQQLEQDVRPFLERPGDWEQLKPELVDRLLADRQKGN
jgi:predicted nucleotidyltransferase component of viral defense system